MVEVEVDIDAEPRVVVEPASRAARGRAATAS
jgi:hypothetical protein